MGNKMRHVYGVSDPQPVAVQAGVVMDVGDVVVKSAGYGLPADAILGASAAAVQESVHDAFVGVSADQRQSNDPQDGVITVTTLGTYHFDCATLGGALNQGTFFGVATQASGISATPYVADPQTLISVATPNLAIGKLAVDAPLGATSVLVELTSTLVHNGTQGVA